MDINIACKGLTPLARAADEGNDAVVDMLINAGADMQKSTDDGETPFVLAVTRRNTKVVKLLLKALADLEKRTSRGETALFIPSELGSVSAGSTVALCGALMDIQCTSDAKTALFIAAENGHTKVVDLLCRAGADITLCSRGGETPLFLAAANGHLEIVNLLLKQLGMCPQLRLEAITVPPNSHQGKGLSNLR